MLTCCRCPWCACCTSSRWSSTCPASTTHPSGLPRSWLRSPIRSRQPCFHQSGLANHVSTNQVSPTMFLPIRSRQPVSNNCSGLTLQTLFVCQFSPIMLPPTWSHQHDSIFQSGLWTRLPTIMSHCCTVSVNQFMITTNTHRPISGLAIHFMPTDLANHVFAPHRSTVISLPIRSYQPIFYQFFNRMKDTVQWDFLFKIFSITDLS